MSETLQDLSCVDFDNLKPVRQAAKLKTFTVVGAELTEKQRKAGYYLQINEGDKIDGIYNGMSTNNQGDFPSTEISILGMDGSETIVKANTSLKNQMASIEQGSAIRLQFTGKTKLTKGAGKGKLVLNWNVYSS